MPAEGGRSFSSSVMIRVLRILLENGELRRSNLCSKAGLNYKVCTRYVNFLAQLRWVAIRKPSDQTMIISISEEGVANLRKLEFQDLTDDFDREAGKTLQNPSDNRVWPNADTRTLGSVKRKPLAKGDVYARSPGKKVVVIIDDDEAALATYAAFLENYKNLEVQKFSDSRKALEHLTLNSGKCDLILLDIRMPGLSGLRLCQAVKATSPAVRIIFISSLDAGSELADMFPDPTLGTRNFLRKPIGRANFIDTVTRALS
ncbi:MAG TPA: response regulator [Nitrososphaera sp.]|nr:response regulator [Nitrososphaera sp.]